MCSVVISCTSGQPCSSAYRATMPRVVSRLARYPSEYRLEAFRLLRNRFPWARRLWSKTCLTTIHLVAPERKSRHFVSDCTRKCLAGGPGWTRTIDLGLIRAVTIAVLFFGALARETRRPTRSTRRSLKAHCGPIFINGLWSGKARKYDKLDINRRVHFEDF